MADYKFTSEPTSASGVQRYEDNAFIPNTTGNRDWRTYLEYVDEGGETDPWKTEDVKKDDSYTTAITGVENANTSANLDDFTYNGDVYVSDKDSIQSVQNQCLTMTGTDPIPTPGGMWVLADDTTVAYTVQDFIVFATDYFMRASNNFGVKTTHKSNIKAIYEDAGQDASDIDAYDYSTNWV